MNDNYLGLIGKTVQIDGHLSFPVFIEGIKTLEGSAVLLQIRTPEGRPDEVVLSNEEFANLGGKQSGEGIESNLVPGADLSLLVESWRIRLAYRYDPYFAISLSGIQSLPHQIEAVYGKMLPLREQAVHQRLIELLRDTSNKLFESIKAHKIMTLMKMGKTEGERQAVKAAVVRDAFFESLDFTRVLDEKAILAGIIQGVKEGLFVFTLKNRVKEESGRFFVKSSDAVYRREVGFDEIDFDEGIILLPECIEGEGVPPEPPKPPETPKPPIGPPGPERGVHNVRIEMDLNKQTLYKAFNALGNLTEKTGAIRAVIVAESKEALDRNWLRNAIMEPLDEAGIDTTFEIE